MNLLAKINGKALHFSTLLLATDNLQAKQYSSYNIDVYYVLGETFDLQTDFLSIKLGFS